jgi:hypothetical protein
MAWVFKPSTDTDDDARTMPLLILLLLLLLNPPPPPPPPPGTNGAACTPSLFKAAPGLKGAALDLRYPRPPCREEEEEEGGRDGLLVGRKGGVSPVPFGTN